MFPSLAKHPLVALCLGLPVCAAAGAAHAHDHHPTESKRCSTDDIVDSITTALEVSRKYRDVAVAEAEGYRPASPCESSPEGTMGIHYVHEEKLAAPPDVSNPPILVYLPAEEGLRLVAIEYFQPVIQDGKPYLGDAPPRPESLPERPPELFEGQPFDGPMAGHNPDMPWHYDQHLWLYEHNPKGLFAMWNPAIACPAEGRP